MNNENSLDIAEIINYNTNELLPTFTNIYKQCRLPFYLNIKRVNI